MGGDAIQGLYFLAVSRPLLEALDPGYIVSDVFVARETDAKIEGENLQEGMKVASNSGDLEFSNVQVKSSREATVRVKVKAKPGKGMFDITITNPDGESDTKNKAFEIR